MAFEVFPEPAGQGGRKLPQAAVIQCGLTLLQVVHQQVTDRPAGQVVTVDQLPGSALARSCQLPQHLRCRGFEDPHPVEHPVEPRPMRHRLGMRAGLGVQQLHDVTNGDLLEQAALGADDDGAAVQDVCPGLGRDVRIAVAQLPQPGEPVRCPWSPACPGSDGRRASLRLRTSSCPDAPHRRRSPSAGPRTAAPAAHRNTGRGRGASPPGPPAIPGRRCRLRWPATGPASCHPADLPASRAATSARVRVPSARRRCPDTNGAQVSRLECLFAACRGRWPAGGHRTRGKPGAHAREGKRRRAIPAHPAPGRGGHDAPFPNRTSSTSGR